MYHKMEELIEELRGCVRPEYSIARIKSDGHQESKARQIALDYTAFDDCPDFVELDNMLRKRLGSKPVGAGSADPKVIAKCCIATGDYSVSHESVCGISEKGMLRVWSTLERAKVTSTDELAKWMKLRLKSRSYDGFVKSLESTEAGVPRTSTGATPRIRSIAPPVAVNLLRINSAVGAALTVRGAMVADARILTGARVVAGLGPPDFEDLLN